MTKSVNIQFAKVRKDAIIPNKRDEDAGYDIYANFSSDTFTISPHSTEMVPTGIASAIPIDYYFQVEERGSTGSKGMKKSAGVVDSGYRGEWFVAITNTNDIPIVISKSATQVNVNKNRITYPYNKAIAQAVLLPVPRTTVQEISFEELQSIPSERGTGKVGSSKK